ncbi:MAG: FtsX-like permease family protein [Erysipelotrichaceae bacterium]|nr:FtsX-like permease family protein [Erysipelotrichaceae bacterium]
MFILETFRLIRRTIKRFLSLTVIVFIGAGFMMGLLSAPKVMRESVDRYYDEYNLQDLMIYSPYGFCKEDYLKIFQTKGVKTVFASKEIDCHGKDEKDEEKTFRVTEVYRITDRYKLIEGRLPQKNDECLILCDDRLNSYKIGDTITFNCGEDDIKEYLSVDKYTITGLVEMSQYMSNIFGSSNYHNEGLDCVVFVPNANFISEYYTTMYVTIDGASDFISNTDDYDAFIEENRIDIDNTSIKQQSYLRDKLIDEATKTLEEKEKLFNEVKEEGKKQLDDAKKQLDDARIQIITYESQLNTMEILIKSLQAQIEADSEILGSIYGHTVEAEEHINDFIELFGHNGVYIASGTMEYLYNEYNNAISQYNSMRAQLNSAEAQYAAGLIEYEKGLAQYNEEIAKGEEELKLARAKLNDLPKSQWIVLNRDQMYSPMMYKNTCMQMEVIGTYMPIMFFLVAALVCLTTMKRLVDEQRGQIGIYTALGYSKIQIIGKYVSYALLASLLGGITGAIFGEALYPSVIYNTWRMMYHFPQIVIMFPLRNALFSVGLFALLMSGITAYVVNASVKDVPAALMRPVAPKKGKEIIVEKITFLWNMLSFTSKITARNIFRYKSRFLMTIAGIAGCTGLLILGFGLRNSVEDCLGIQYGEIFNYDYLINFTGSDHIEENLEILKSEPSVDFAADYLSYTTRAYLNGDEKTAETIVIDPSVVSYFFTLRETDKKTPIKLNNEGVVVSERFAKNNNLKVGDYITIESGNRIKGEVMISNICEMYFQHYIFMTETVYENVFDEEVKGTLIAVNSDEGDRVKTLAKNLSDYASVTDIGFFLDSFNDMIQAMNLVIGVIILVAGSLAFVVLINLTQVNISERIREIATLKVLGFNDHEVNMYIFKEILLLSLIGCVVGVPIGIIEHRFIMGSLNMEMIMFGNVIKLPSYLISFVITIVFTLIVLIFMRRPLRKVNMVESLKSVE